MRSTAGGGGGGGGGGDKLEFEEKFWIEVSQNLCLLAFWEVDDKVHP